MAIDKVNQPSSLPPYPKVCVRISWINLQGSDCRASRSIFSPFYNNLKMILEAIEALGENGEKKMISQYIESAYAELPQGHSGLLETHLNKMKMSGEIIFLRNKYKKSSPNFPPKRGRGRPPKPKAPLPSSIVSSPSRFTSGPLRNLNVHPKSSNSKASSGSGRPRGRPRKIRKIDDVLTPTSTKMPRGRPKKIVNVMATQPLTSTAKPRGRPKKIVNVGLATPPIVTKRPRGRPKKIINVEVQPTTIGRPRGRPKKIANVGVATPPIDTKRPRGRPKKIVNVEVISTSFGRPRGRPKKIVDLGLTSLPICSRRLRDRPPKIKP